MQKRTDFTAMSMNPLLTFITAKKYRWLRHVLFISSGLILAFKGDIGVSDQRSPEAMPAILLVDGLSFLFILGILYFMLWVSIPKLLFRSRFILFAVSFFISVVIIYLVVWFLDFYFLKPADPSGKGMNMQHIEISFVNFIQVGIVCAVLMASVVGLVVFKKWISDVQHMNELQKANLETELEQLKSQVNPHFLFNTLNNLLVLTKTDPEKATQVLLGLSDLLRYQLYDSAREKILLSKDIEFIHNLLALEKIRKDDFSYEIQTEGQTGGILLAPFLFIPFVENAIKHGASAVGHSYLKLQFRITYKMLHFKSENSKPSTRHNLPGGIGLKNIKRRLALLYRDNYILDIKDDADKYIVNLTLPL
jgi:sensor histidine kinase YesM